MIDTMTAIAAGYRTLAADVDRLNDDHTPAAIFRRAWRASMADASKSRRWKARAIGLNPEPLHNAIALSGMAPIRIDDVWHLGIAVPQPSPVDHKFDAVTDVVLIHPRTGAASVMGDRGATHVGPHGTPDRLVIHTDAKAWARDVALHRLEWFRLHRQRRDAIQAEPTWSGDVPAALLLTTPARVRWHELRAGTLDVPAHLRRDVQRAIFAQARLPKIEGRA